MRVAGCDDEGGYEGEAQKDFDSVGVQDASETKRRILEKMSRVEVPGPPEKTCSCPDAAWRPGVVLDPFLGSGTTALVAKRLGRHFVGIELNPKYVEIARRRISPAMNGRLEI